MLQPARHFARQRADVALANHVQIGRQRGPFGREEAGVRGIGIRAADQTQFHHVVRWHHPRVARMELVGQALGRERRSQRVHAVGDEERWALGSLGEEVPHRAIERAGHANGDAIARDERERALDAAHRIRVGRQHPRPRLVLGHVMEHVQGRVQKIDDPLDVTVHCTILPLLPWAIGLM